MPQQPMTLGDFSPGRDIPGKILIVDDDSVTRRFLRQQSKILGFDSVEAANGREALEVLRANPGAFDVVLLDRTMPEMDGMAVIMQMNKDAALSRIPVIMQTSSSAPEEVQEGIDAGVFYYLTKPIDPALLKTVLRTAVADRRHETGVQERDLAHDGLSMMQSASFQFRTVEEAQILSRFIAGMFPEPSRVTAGLAELMVNAIEHGNLGIGYEMKAQLCRDGTWRDEIHRRMQSPAIGNRAAEITLTRKDGGIYAVISDQGEGFDWKNFLKINPTRAGDAHGRGIAMANSISFDKLTYNDKGNKAVAYVADTSLLDW